MRSKLSFWNSVRFMIICFFAFALESHAADTRGQQLTQGLINQIPVVQSGSVNNGYTSFFDGFGGTNPGWAYQGFWTPQIANSVKDGNGNNVITPANPHIFLFGWANELIYTSPYTIGGGSLGVITVVPIIYTHATSDPFPPPFPPGKTLTANGTGFGDLVFGSFLQFKPLIQNGRPILDQRVELDVFAPTGRYNTIHDVQPGGHFWALNPYWAVTWLAAPKWEISDRLQYIYNFKNTAPADVPPVVRSTQAGQAVFANFTTSYQVIPQLHVGLNGYFFRQITQSNVNGISQNNSEREYLGLGPGMLWAYSNTEKFFVNFYVQTDVKNAPKYDVGLFRWLHLF